MNTTHDPRSVGTLVTDLVQQMATLLQTEARLFRAEINEKLQQAINGAGELIGGAVLLLAALLVLLQALVVGLSELGLGPGWASLIVGVVVAIIGAILVRRGMSNMSPSELAPDRTAAQLRLDMQVAKEQLR